MLNRTITYRTMTGFATLLFVILLALIYFNSNRPNSPHDIKKISENKLIPLQARVKAPKVIWQDLAGAKLDLNDYTGKVLYLNFWALWCEPCKTEIPLLAQINTQISDPRLKFLLINMDDSSENIKKAQSFIQTSSPLLESLFSVSEVFKNHFSVDVLPSHIIIDKKGRIATSFYGDVLDQQKEVRLMLQHLLQEN